MTIWIVGALLVVLGAVLGYFLGGVRTAVSLVGTLIAAAAATAVGGLVSGIIPSIGFRNPVWQFYLPPLLGFLILGVVFLIVSLVVHHLVQKHYRNNTDEYTFARWFRLNSRTGAALGAVLGSVWLVLIGIVAYVPGYLATQLADSEEGSMPLRTASNLTHGMEQTGLNRIVEHYQPAGEDHYRVADILGLVYNNPSIHSRLASYPPFLGLAEKPEIAELAKDPEVNTLIQSKAGLAQILEHARIQAVTENHDLVNELLALDFKDLGDYLRTGISEKYKEERILGRWRLNVRRSIAEMKTVSSEKLPTVEFNLLRKALNVYLDDLTIGFTTDNKAIVKVKAKDEQKLLQTVGRASASASAQSGAAGGGEAGGGGGSGGGGGLTARSIAARAVPQPSPQDSQAELLRQRYGVGSGGGRGGAQAQSLAQPLANTTGVMPVRQAPKPPTSTPIGPLMTSGDGSWSKAGEAYQFSVSRDGKEVKLDARVKENQLIATVDGRTLVFDRI
ncbi:MAG: CvpA family protein [Verrucomicrobiales bacterium]|nr:CvpA family protein [Verrucomicrobiales bacterium]